MGQHKFNPTAQAAKEGKLPPKPPGMSAAEIRRRLMGAVEAATGADKLMAALRGELPKDHPMQLPPRQIKTWEELDGLTSWDGRYRIEVGFEHGSGQIVPTFPVEDKNYWDHTEYLSTHTFYEGTYRAYTQILRKFGFNVQLVSWG